MTDRRRFNDQMHYEPPDRCFNMEFGYWEDNFKTWPIFVDNGITSNGQADAFFNFDTIRSTGGSIWIHPAFEELFNVRLGEWEPEPLLLEKSASLAESKYGAMEWIRKR